MQPIKIPTNCPACNSPLILVNTQLFCKNTSCDAQITKKLEHFCKVLSIKGLGPKSLEKLDLRDIPELFFLDKDDIAAALDSEKLAVKLLDEINKARNASLETVLAAFSIPLVGETASKKICSVVQHISEITYEKCKEAGLGDKVTANLLSWLDLEFKELQEHLPFTWQSNKKSETKPSGKIVCISGKMQSFKTKSEAEQALAAAGFQYSDSVTKQTNYLVDEENKGSLKRKKAESYSIPIINNLKSFLEENTK